MTRRVEWKIEIAAIVMALLAAVAAGCSSKDEKGCGQSCSDDSECVSGHKCLTPTGGSKQCVPEECQGCGSSSTCVYSSPTDNKCSFLRCE